MSQPNRCRMTGRERLRCILNREPADRLSWTTVVDDGTRSVMPDEARRLSPIDFYRSIGCDIVQLGSYGLGKDLAVPRPSRLISPEVNCEIETEEDGRVTRRQLAPDDVEIGMGRPAATGRVTRRRISPWGTLTTVLKHDHPVEHAVKSLQDVRLLRQIWEASDYVEQPGMEQAIARLDRQIGEDGMYVPTLDPSPVQELLEYEMGTANFYYLLNDHRREVEELLAVMHRKRLGEYEILARRSPVEVVVPLGKHQLDVDQPQSVPDLQPAADPRLRQRAAPIRQEGRVAHVRAPASVALRRPRDRTGRHQRGYAAAGRHHVLCRRVGCLRRGLPALRRDLDPTRLPRSGREPRRAARLPGPTLHAAAAEYPPGPLACRRRVAHAVGEIPGRRGMDERESKQGESAMKRNLPC